MESNSADIWRKVLERQAFDSVFAELGRDEQSEILKELNALLESTRIKLADKIYSFQAKHKSTRGDVESCRADILQEMMNLKACMKRFSDPLSEYALKEIELRRAAPELAENIFNRFVQGLDDIFEQKRQMINQAVDAEVRWTSGMADASRKMTRGILGAGALAADKMSDFAGERAGKTLSGLRRKVHVACEEIKIEDLLTQIWTRHIADEGELVNRLMNHLLEQYDQAWKALAPYGEVCGDSNFVLRRHSRVNQAPAAADNPAEKACQAAVAVTAATTAAISAGWHTFNYAMVHVFPPAALVSIAAMTVIGIKREDNYKEQVKAQFSRCLQIHRQDYLRMWLEKSGENGEEQEPLRISMLKEANQRIEAALCSWRYRLFGRLEMSVHKSFLQAAEQHLLLLGAALESLDDELAAISRRRAEYASMRERLAKQYTGMDPVSLDILSTGETLFLMHAERPFPECSPLALPFTKVLERELHRIFGVKFAQCSQNRGKKNEFLLGPFIGFLEDGKITGGWTAGFVLRLRAANLVRRSLAHRTPITFEKAAHIRELMIGEQDLLGEIRALA